MQQIICDLEVYKNYFLCQFMRVSDNKIRSFEKYNDKELDIDKIKDILKSHEIITFNGLKYDMLLLELALNGASCSLLKNASDDIIQNNMIQSQFKTKYNISEKLNTNHIDIIELCIGKASLKAYGGRLHVKKLQDLPIEPDCLINKEQRELLKEYCVNDLFLTKRILKEITPQLDLRRKMSKQYMIDLRSKSDAQIAEEVIKTEIRKITGKIPIKNELKEKVFKYIVPNFIQFETPKLNEILNMLQKESFFVKEHSIVPPKALSDTKIKIGSSIYQMGIGGLHSTESSVNYSEDEIFFIVDKDVISFYPSIILNCKLYPEGLGNNFLKIYQKIVEERIAAKKKISILKKQIFELKKDLQDFP